LYSWHISLSLCWGGSNDTWLSEFGLLLHFLQVWEMILLRIFTLVVLYLSMIEFWCWSDIPMKDFNYWIINLMVYTLLYFIYIIYILGIVYGDVYGVLYANISILDNECFQELTIKVVWSGRSSSNFFVKETLVYLLEVWWAWSLSAPWFLGKALN